MRALVLALAVVASLPARAAGGPAISFCAGGGVLQVTQATNRGSIGYVYPLLEAHAEVGLPVRGGALVLLGDLALPLDDKSYGALITAGGGLRIGPPALQLTLGGGYTYWDSGGSGLTGASLFAHVQVPISGGFGLHLTAGSHFLAAVSGTGVSIGVGYSE